MRPTDTIVFAAHAIASHRLRSGLTVLGIAIGIGAVVLLTAIGTGVQRFVLQEFTQFGTNLLAVTPGKKSTMGISGAVIGTVRPLSLDDERAVARLPGILATVPVVQGNAAVEAGTRQRRATVLGVGPRAPEVWRFRVATGRFLPEDDPRAARPLVVLGSTVRRELFANDNPLGRIVRIGGMRFRVVGTMESKGVILGLDIDDAVYIPAGRALAMFDREGLMEIDVLYEEATAVETIAARLRRLLRDRHGREDFTITTQEGMLDVLGAILDKLTLAVAALGAISLLVGAVGILTIMTIAVHDRTAEIGLLRALGAGRGQVLRLFLAEAVALASLGGILGLAGGWGGALLLHLAVASLPISVSVGYSLAALAVAVAIGLGAGIMPALHAAALDPVEALRTE